MGYFPGDGHWEGFRFFNLEIAGSTTGQGPFMGGRDTSDVDICNVYIHDGDIGVYFGAERSVRWYLRHSRIERMSASGILGGCTDCVIDANYFGSDSFGPNNVRDHPLYISGHGVQRMRVTNNEIHTCRPGTAVGTAALVVHGRHEDLWIENNLIQCDYPSGVSGHEWGISLNHGSYTDSEPSGFLRTSIRRNRIINSIGSGIELSQSPHALIEGNLVVMASNANGSYGIVAGLMRSRPGLPDALTTHVTIRNNTVYFPAAAPNANTGIAVMSEGDHHVVTNNVMYFARDGATRCLGLPLHATSYSALSNNACNGDWGTIHDLARVRLRASPFVDAGVDFTPAANSPLVDAGSASNSAPSAPGGAGWSANDKGRPRGTRPDIGAFER